MKLQKIITVLFLSGVCISGVSAKFAINEIDPVCSISGNTYTNSAAGQSDTSSWHMIVAYEGTCEVVPSLSQSQKDKVFTIIDDFFTKNDYYKEMYSSLNSEGRDFVRSAFFPTIKNRINRERAKQNQSGDVIAILNYAASIVKYDYAISR